MMFDHPDFDAHEMVAYLRDPDAGLSAIVAIHSSALGPGFGGCRMYPYASDALALADALRLSRGMTYKAAICDLPYGGGKSVILGDPRRDKTPGLLRAMGRAVDRFGGRYVVADDVGTSLEDLAVMRTETRHTAAATDAAKQPLPATAWGVFNAILAAVAHCFGQSDLKGLTVAVQGLGHVGYPLCRFLRDKGARLVVSDMDAERLRQAEAEFAATSVSVDAIYDVDAAIFSPCALGGVLSDATIPRLKARLVCGGANNQLAAARHDAELGASGILYVPDYLANAGGVIDFHQESVDDRPSAVLESVARIGPITASVLDRAKSSGQRPLAVADAIVAERLRAARARRPG